jgi:N-formylmaleamate deformylase
VQGAAAFRRWRQPTGAHPLLYSAGPTPVEALPMTSWTTGVHQADGVNIHYRRTGRPGPPLVLLHGLTGSGACWTPVARALEDELDVLMPDARGHGRSSAPLHGYRYEDHAKDIVGLIRGLALAAPSLLGHSMGGMTAALVAGHAGEDINAVILADPTFLSPQRQREVRDSDVLEQHRRALGLTRAELMAEMHLRHPHRSPEMLELLAEARLQTRMSAWDVLTPPIPDYRRLVSMIRVPALLVIGDSPVVPLETARELQGLNPGLRVEQIPGAGHGIAYDQPARFATVVRSFLRSVA